jgi:hypothetical protein
MAVNNSEIQHNKNNLLTVPTSIMSAGINFNHTRNRSNGSNFGPGQYNDSSFDKNSFDESPEIMFDLLVTLVIPSIICSLFLFYNFIRLPQLRNKPSNLLIICLLIVNFIHVSYFSSIFSKFPSFSFIATD